MTRGLPTFEGDGLGRIGIVVAPSDSRRLYATVEAEPQRRACTDRTTPASPGSARHEDVRVTTRGDDFAEVKVDPKNPDIVYTGNIVTWKSTDGGKTFTAFRGAPGGDDYHRVWINPDNPDILMLASDQGAIVTVNGGETWSSWYNQPTAQFYHVSTDNAFPYRVCGGQQESGSACVASRGNYGQITFREWTPVGVEEYGYVAPDPLNPDIVYGGKVSRFDRRTGQVQQVGPVVGRGSSYRTVRTEPVLFSPIDPHTLYFASNTVWKTLNGGRTWTQISPDLTRETWDAPPSVGKYIGTPGRPAVAARRHLHARAVVRGHQPDLGRHRRRVDSRDHRRRQDLEERDAARADAVGKVSVMDASHTDPLTAYAAINTLRLDDLRPHIYRTRDGGKTWTQSHEGHSRRHDRERRAGGSVRKGLLFAGTEQQVFFSIDDGENWQSLRLNMPATSIRDLDDQG